MAVMHLEAWFFLFDKFSRSNKQLSYSKLIFKFNLYIYFFCEIEQKPIKLTLTEFI